MPGKCVFSELWLENESYKTWLVPTNDVRKGRCKICAKDINIAQMGESALKVHMKGQKHIALAKGNGRGCLLQFLKPSGPIPTISANVISTPLSNTLDVASSSSNACITSFTTGKEVLAAEVIWALKTIDSNFSYNSSRHSDKLFAAMFPDSAIAKQFSCGEKKVAYLCCFGLAPHFEKVLFKCLDDVTEYTLLFDETLNICTQRKQMDVLIRFWNSDTNLVQTRYFTSTFMGHCTADDIFDSFKFLIKDLKFNLIQQISMDGPSVNLKFFKMFQSEMENDYGKKIIDIGSCGLHTLHNSFKQGVSDSGWDLELFLKSIYYLFKDSPARMEDFLSVSVKKKIGLKFCCHRWLENLPAAQRALEIIEDLKIYVTHVEKKKFPKPTCNSYKVIVVALKDKLLKAKLDVFVAIAQIIQPFLKMYQSDKPLLPFLALDITKLVNHTLSTFNILKVEEVKRLKYPSRLALFDLEAAASLNEISKISLGFSADKEISSMMRKKEVTEKDVKRLKYEVQLFVIGLVKKILHKSPLNYSLVRNASCLDPKNLIDQKEKCKIKMKNALAYLVECGQLKEDKCDIIMCEYSDFLLDVPSSECRNFNPEHQDARLEDFFFRNMYMKGYSNVWAVVKKILALSHGQATVESGFSVNKCMEVENLKERSYISKRRIKDFIKFSGGINNIEMTRELLLSAGCARQRYMLHLEEEKKVKESERLNCKKRKIQEELENLKKKKSDLESNIFQLEKSADEFNENAEKLNMIHLCSHSNALRKSAREKKIEVQNVVKEIDGKLIELKNTL